MLATLALLPVAGAMGFGLVKLAPAAAPSSCEAAKGPIAEAASYATLDPIVVALAPEAGARSLRIGLAVGMADDHASLSDTDVLRLRDGFLDALRRVDSGVVTDPEAMPHLREELLGAARSILGEHVVASVLVTEFVMR